MEDEEMKINEEKLGQEPAFPAKKLIVTGKEFSHYINDNGTKAAIFKDVIDEVKLEGMSKRFYAACAAMQGLLATGNHSGSGTYNPFIGRISFEIADELLKAENK
jgi:hypothetical protein